MTSCLLCWLRFLRVYYHKWYSWIIYSIFNFLRELFTDFPSGYLSLHSHKQYIRVPLYPTSLLALVAACFNTDSQSERGGVQSQCSFNFHFPDDQGCWALFYALLAICTLAYLLIGWWGFWFWCLIFLVYFYSKYQSLVACRLYLSSFVSCHTCIRELSL